MIISWNVTKACNLKCLHCYRDAGNADEDELNTKEGVELLKEIAAANFKIMVFSGGEPLLRKDIYELIQAASRLGLRAVLGTNGTLIDAKVVGRLKESGLSRAGISIDSVNNMIHDEFRQEKGAWQRSVDAMVLCKSLGLEFQAHTTVTGLNWQEVGELTDLVSRLGAKAHHIFFLVPTGRGKGIESTLLGPNEYSSLMEKVLKKQKDSNIELKCVCAPQFVPMAMKMGMVTRFSRGCLAGISYCCVLPNGDVYPCPYMPVKAGNVRTTPFRNIWKESSVFNKLRSLEYQDACGVCGHKKSCGGCRARALNVSGEYMGEDPYCMFMKREPANVNEI